MAEERPHSYSFVLKMDLTPYVQACRTYKIQVLNINWLKSNTFIKCGFHSFTFTFVQCFLNIQLFVLQFNSDIMHQCLYGARKSRMDQAVASDMFVILLKVKSLLNHIPPFPCPNLGLLVASIQTQKCILVYSPLVCQYHFYTRFWLTVFLLFFSDTVEAMQSIHAYKYGHQGVVEKHSMWRQKLGSAGCVFWSSSSGLHDDCRE